MTDEVKKEVVTVDADFVRTKCQDTWQFLGQVAESVKQTAYLSGIMDASNFLFHVGEATRFADPERLKDYGITDLPKLDIVTIQWLLDKMNGSIAQQLSITPFMDISPPPEQEQSAPEGTKLN